MAPERIVIEKRSCILYSCGTPCCLLIQPVGVHELDGLTKELDTIRKLTDKPFAYAAFETDDWNRELSPWEAAPVFGKEPFGSGAAATLEYAEKALIPGVAAKLGLSADIPVIVGGYSLAGLFALWAAYTSEMFAAAAGVSPSVWFPGWQEFTENRKPCAKSIYLSLGRKEEKTRNKALAAVGDSIRRQHGQLLSQGKDTVLEWNDGDHFTEPWIRTAWCINSI